MIQSFNVFCATESNCSLLKRNGHAFYKLLEPVKHFTWQVVSRICDGSVGHCPLDHETTGVGSHLSVFTTFQILHITLVFERNKGVTQSEL
jgi:hypothetical protein